jgi:hypothetical protein
LLSAEDQYSVDAGLYLAKSHLKNFGYCVAKIMDSPETEGKEANLARARLRLTRVREDFNFKFYLALIAALGWNTLKPTIYGQCRIRTNENSFLKNCAPLVCPSGAFVKSIYSYFNSSPAAAG